MAAAPIGKGYSAAQWEAWFTANSKSAVPVSISYQGTQLQGKTWSQVYATVYAYGLSKGVTAPDDAAATTIEIALEAGLGSAVGQGAGEAVDLTSGSKAGLEQASLLPSWADGLANLLGDLTSKNLWIRVAKIVVGGAMVLIAVGQMTGAGKVAGDAAKLGMW